MGHAMTLSRILVRQWKELSVELIPEDVMHHGLMHCIDACGVGLAASSLEQGVPYARYAGTQADVPHQRRVVPWPMPH